MNIDIHAITVCVNYAHLFQYCMPNRRFFKRWTVITTKEDKETIALCKQNDIEVIFSKTLYNRQFAKGCAINEVIDHIGYDKEWYLHIDADVLLPNNFSDTFPTDERYVDEKGNRVDRPQIIGTVKRKCVSVDSLQITGPFRHYMEYTDEGKYRAVNLYTMGRVNVDEEENFKNFNPQLYFDRPDEIVQRFKGYGYFQLWHMPTLLELYPDLHHVYPSLSSNAGHDDWIFSKMFYQIVSLQSYCIHLSPEKLNWDGKYFK